MPLGLIEEAESVVDSAGSGESEKIGDFLAGSDEVGLGPFFCGFSGCGAIPEVQRVHLFNSLSAGVGPARQLIIALFMLDVGE
jgi:ribonuclease HIII